MNMYIGSKYSQVCDSQGSHNNAKLTDLPNGTTTVQWLPTIRGENESWDNIYIWDSKPFVLSSTVAKFVYCVDVIISDLSNLNAWEFEVQAVNQKRKYNLAWQFTNTTASTFDFVSKKWVKEFSLNAPVLSPGVWSRFCAFYQINQVGPQHLGIQFDGTYMPINRQRNYVSTNESNYLNFAFQFDSLNKGTEIDATVCTRLITI